MAQMRDYQVYIVDDDDRIVAHTDLDCTDDSVAIECAKQFVNGHDIELWQRDRRITKLDRKLVGQ
jgi:hypothetical protein